MWLGGKSEGRKVGNEAREEGWRQFMQGLVDHEGNMDFILINPVLILFKDRAVGKE